MRVSPESTFFARTRAARKVIVVDLGFLGDSAHLIPALWEIKRHYAGAELHTLSAPVGAEMLQLAPCVTRAWSFPLTPESPAWWRHWDIIAALRREHFDAAYNFSGADRTIFLTALTGAPQRVARTGARQHFWSRWLIANWVAAPARDLPVYEQRRQVLAACGLSLEPAKFDLRVPEAARQWAQKAVAGRCVHFSINASGPEKEWPLESWVALARSLLEKEPDLGIVATASGKTRERERLHQLREGARNERLGCFEDLSIAQLAALLERCQLHIGADSGVLHLAMALDVPTLGIFREYEGLQEWLPRGKAHRHLAAPSLGSISSQAVAEEVRRMREGAV